VQTISASFAASRAADIVRLYLDPGHNGFYFYAQDPLVNPVPYDSLDIDRDPAWRAGTAGQYLDEVGCGPSA
jgi:hypothetical protein